MSGEERMERAREAAIDAAKLRLGFGWGMNPGPCHECGSRVSRKVRDRYECWDHYTGPLQMEIAT